MMTLLAVALLLPGARSARSMAGNESPVIPTAPMRNSDRRVNDRVR
jgi:hypothetical protein